ncbi:MAG TPA: efflux RND transporter periplasmic adaptor subunit [Burkholderiales bacterium]|nr:efflux RND transporter periplasmic adaptor subunit [Burkholderiales bacterium]
MNTRTKIALGIVVAGVAAAVVWALQPRPVLVETASVTSGVFEQTVSDDGKTRVRNRYVVAAPLAGHLDRIRFDAGDWVREGDVIARLNPTAPAFLDARTARELQARIGAAQAQLARASAESAKVQAQRDQARADLERQSRLSKEGFVSPTVREQAELTMRTAERAFDAARFGQAAAGHDLEQAKAALTRYKEGTGDKWDVTSPVSGSVLRVLQKSEGPVALGAPLVELADARSLEIVVDVLSQEAVAIRTAMPARVELGRGVPPLAAQVRLVEPGAFTKVSALGVEEQRVNVVLDFAEPLDRIQTIGDGYRADAHIVIFRADAAVKAPVGALFREGDGWAVFVADGDRAVKRPVKAPRRNGFEAMVEEGLKPGERVVVYPSDSLKDGSRLEVRSASRAG